jgi:hypothetical protein
MAAFLVRSNLSRGDLRLFLSNSNGYAQDASKVTWTVYNRDGRQVSGHNLPAIRQKCGEYYAPWFTNVPNGSYKCIWEVTQEFGGPTVRLTDFVFVVDPSSYQCGTPLNKDAIPAPGQFTFLTGQALGPGDLPLYLKNNDGYPQNAYCVFYTILDCVGNHMGQRRHAKNAGVGIYWADYFVNLCSGNYTILWEWQTDLQTPLKSIRCPFSVVSPGAPYSVVIPIMCNSSLFLQNCQGLVSRPILTRVLLAQCEPCAGGCATPSLRYEPCPSFIPPFPVPPPCPPPSPTNCCSAVEIPRTVHLLTQVLPPSGNWTNQPPYLIPDCIKKICFYITYSRGAPGGYALLRMLWGNGTDETQQTLIDLDFTAQQPNSFQNMYLQDLEGPIPQTSAPVNFMVEVSVPGGCTTVRLVASEGGVPGAPGSIGITLTASNE